MNAFYQILCPRAFSLIFAASAGMMACSSGTSDGDTNVERGSSKDKDPTERNEVGQNTSSNVKNHYDSLEALQDTARIKNDAYERNKEKDQSHTKSQ